MVVVVEKVRFLVCLFGRCVVGECVGVGWFVNEIMIYGMSVNLFIYIGLIYVFIWIIDYCWVLW